MCQIPGKWPSKALSKFRATEVIWAVPIPWGWFLAQPSEGWVVDPNGQPTRCLPEPQRRAWLPGGLWATRPRLPLFQTLMVLWDPCCGHSLGTEHPGRYGVGTQEYGAGLAVHSWWCGLARKLLCLPGDCAWIGESTGKQKPTCSTRLL